MIIYLFAHVRHVRLYHHPHEYGVDTSNDEPTSSPQYKPHFTRAYIHHLLHAHEMSAHALLAMHNIQVLSAFLSGILHVMDSSTSE